MIDRTNRIRYTTGFHFNTDGSVLVSTYGRGIWKLLASAASCESGEDWIPELVQIPGGFPTHPGGPRLNSFAEDPGAAKQLSGEDVPGRAVAILGSNSGSAGKVVAGADGVLHIRTREFDPEGGELSVEIAGLDQANFKTVMPNSQGEASFDVRLPRNLEYGVHNLVVKQQQSRRSAGAEFIKTHLDEALGQSAETQNDETLQEKFQKLIKKQTGNPNVAQSAATIDK